MLADTKIWHMLYYVPNLARRITYEISTQNSLALEKICCV